MPSSFGFEAPPDRLYKPRMTAILTVPKFGASRAEDEKLGGADTVTVPIMVRRANLVRNDHRTADILNVSCDYVDCGIDPRLLRQANINFWLDDLSDIVSDQTVLEPQFQGIAMRAHRISKEGGGIVVDLEFHDYTALFLAAKPFSSEGIPKFTDTLRQGWQRICDNTGWYSPAEHKTISNVEIFKNALVFVGVDESAVGPIGAGISDRLRRLGEIPAQQGKTSNAWDIWQHCVQMLGLLSYIDGDKCIVSTTTEHFAKTREDSKKKAPILRWGSNVLEVDETSTSKFLASGLCLSSFDPLRHRVIESFYPPVGDKRIFVKRAVAKRKHFDPNDVLPQSDSYEYLEFHQVHDQAQLDLVAKAAYDEFSRQNVEGTVKTTEMRVQNSDGEDFNLLDLRAGDSIRVDADLLDKENLSGRFPLEVDRVFLLTQQGYSESGAKIIAHSLDALKSLDTIFHVKQINVAVEDEKFELSIEYHNLVDIATALGLDSKPAPNVPELDGGRSISIAEIVISDPPPPKPTPGDSDWLSQSDRSILDGPSPTGSDWLSPADRATLDGKKK